MIPMEIHKSSGATRAFEMIVLASLFAASMADGQPSPEAGCIQRTLLVPAYFYPDPGSVYWTKLIEAARRVPLVAIMNPDNGPGTLVDPNYTAVCDSLHSVGAKAIGYVYTSYGGRSLSEVFADLDRFESLYPVDGFFVDEMSNDPATSVIDYYAKIYDHAKNLDSSLLVVGNPGTETEEAYLTRPTADVLVTYEDAQGQGNYDPPPWVYYHSYNQFAHLYYDVPGVDSMYADLGQAMTRNAAWVFVTDDSLPNPWDTLPDYWFDEYNVVICSDVPRGSPRTIDLSLRAYPLPLRAGENLVIEARVPADARLWIADVQGRLVRSLRADRLPAGDWRIEWNGRDERGLRAAPGVYLVIAESGGRRAASRILLLR